MKEMIERTPILPDCKLDYLGNLYRMYCGVNDVWIKGGVIITFEDFIKERDMWEQLRRILFSHTDMIENKELGIGA